jgi:rhomboid protease GluP
MWIARPWYPEFGRYVYQRTVALFVAWLIGCFALTYLKIWEVGNAAHLTGMLFGCAVAAYFVARFRPRVTMAALAILCVAAVIPLFWNPWSVAWLSYKAFQSHEKGHSTEAIDYYSRIIARDPANAWAYHNRGTVYHSISSFDKASADLAKAEELYSKSENSP